MKIVKGKDLAPVFPRIRLAILVATNRQGIEATAIDELSTL
jgi:hypothetical protein